MSITHFPYRRWKPCASLIRAAAVLLIAAHPSLLAQQGNPPQKIIVGLGGSIETGLEMSRIPVYQGGSEECGLFTGGTGNSQWFGGRILLPSLISQTSGISIGVGYASGEGTLTSQPSEALFFPLSADSIERVEHEHQLTRNIQSLRLDILWRTQLWNGWYLSAGPSIGYRLGGSVVQSDNVTGNTDFRFEGGEIARTMIEGEPLTLARESVGFLAGTSLALELSPRFLVQPEISVRYDLLSSVAERNWTTLSMGFGVTFLYDLTPGDQPDTTLPPPPRPNATDTVATSTPSRIDTMVISEPSHVQTSVDLYGLDADDRRLPAATVTIYEVLHRQRTPLLTSLYFDKGRDVIPERYLRLSPEEAERFTIDSLFGLPALEIHHRWLNVLGDRMRRNPSSRITLSGSASKDETRSLGRSRAAEVKRYLSSTWGIDPSRIGISDDLPSPVTTRQHVEDGRAEHRFVAVVAEPPALLDPVVSERLTRELDPPLLGIDPRFDASRGVKQWKIDITHDERLVGTFSNSDTRVEEAKLDWEITADRVERKTSMLLARLTVEDSSGSTSESIARLPLVIDRRFRIIDREERLDNSREMTVYTLLGFDYNSSEIGRRNMDIVHEIAESLRPGASVTVTGYTDRSGTDESNLELSKDRAARVTAALRTRIKSRRLRDIRMKDVAGGVSMERYENDLPEGRVLSREVVVVVEQVKKRK